MPQDENTDIMPRSTVTFADGTTINLPTVVANHVVGVNEIGPVVKFAGGYQYYATTCCGAMISNPDEVTSYCKVCHEEADSALSAVPEGVLVLVSSVRDPL